MNKIFFFGLLLLFPTWLNANRPDTSAHKPVTHSSICATATGGICTITGDGVRMRETPSKANNDNVITHLKKGEEVYYIKSHDVYDYRGNYVESWYLVQIPRNGKQGWVYADYCECYDLN
ncbi:MAG: hypothetical protein ACKO6L_09340 [Flavobacteriales bacterium]